VFFHLRQTLTSFDQSYCVAPLGPELDDLRNVGFWPDGLAQFRRTVSLSP